MKKFLKLMGSGLTPDFTWIWNLMVPKSILGYLFYEAASEKSQQDFAAAF